MDWFVLLHVVLLMFLVVRKRFDMWFTVVTIECVLLFVASLFSKQIGGMVEAVLIWIVSFVVVKRIVEE